MILKKKFFGSKIRNMCVEKAKYFLENIKEDYIEDNHMQFRHFAIMFDRNMEFIYGTNRPCISRGKYSIHAEEDVLRRFSKLNNHKKKKYQIMILRVTDKGNLCDSRPCIHCLRLIKESGIRVVHYSTRNRDINREKITNMYDSIENKYSSGVRHLMKNR